MSVIFETTRFSDFCYIPAICVLEKENYIKEMETSRSIFISKKCVFENGVFPAILIVENGKVVTIVRDFDDNELGILCQVSIR